MAMQVWTKDVRDATIEIHSDNEAVVSVLNKLYSKNKDMRVLLKPIALWCMTRNLTIKASHVAGESNVGPDLLSRNKMEEFFKQFPTMKPEPLAIPNHLLPLNVNL